MPDWPHSPVHRFAETGTYIITAGTLRREHLFSDARRLDLLHESILSVAQAHSVELQSWSVFSNHYHLVANSAGDQLRSFVNRLHSTTAVALNSLDEARGRRVWFQYWDTMIRNERSWLARLRYVMENPVRHGLVSDATKYRWCSASWFECTAKPSLFATVNSFPIDRVSIVDSFEVDQIDLDGPGESQSV